MVVTIFRNRSSPRTSRSNKWRRDVALAKTHARLRVAQDFCRRRRRRVTIVEFADEASQRGWFDRAAPRRGEERARAEFYHDYKLQVCSVTRESIFTA